MLVGTFKSERSHFDVTKVLLKSSTFVRPLKFEKLFTKGKEQI